MNPAPTGPPEEDGHGYDTALNLSAAKLDVYRHERLAYTEVPRKHSARRPVFKRASVVLEAAYFRVLACLRKLRRFL